MLKILIASTSLCTIFLGPVAMAQDVNRGLPVETTGFYLGGGYTYLNVERDRGDIGNDTNALMGRVGYQFAPMFSVEAEATFGIDNGEFDFEGSEDDFDFDDDEDGSLDDVLLADGELGVDYLVGLYGRFTAPITDRFDVSVRAGYAYIEIDSTLATIAGNQIRLDASESGFAIGGGAGFDLTERQQIRADYTRYEFDDAHADGASITYGYKF